MPKLHMDEAIGLTNQIIELTIRVVFSLQHNYAG
jgi:hypothetical protein